MPAQPQQSEAPDFIPVEQEPDFIPVEQPKKTAPAATSQPAPVTLDQKRGGSTVTSIPKRSLGDELYDMGRNTLNSIYQVSTPGIAFSFINKHEPELGEHFGPLSTHAAKTEELPSKIGSFAPMMIGEEAPPPESGPVLGESAPTSRPSPIPSSPAAPERSTLGRGIDIASHVPGKIGIGARILRRLGVGDVTPPPTPTAPEVPPWWGKRIGEDIGDPELWGKRVPEPPSTPIDARPANVKLPGEIPPLMTRPRAFFGGIPPEPIPSRPGLLLKGTTEGAITPDEVIPPGKLSRAEIGRKLDTGLNEGLKAEPLKRDVPLRQQLGRQRIPETTPGEHTPIHNSSALKSYHYNPENQEFSVTTHDGTTHVYGEVTPEQAKAFENAESKGKAWKVIRDNSTPVAKIVNGKRLPRIPTQFRSATPDDLTPDLEESLRQVKRNGLRTP